MFSHPQPFSRRRFLAGAAALGGCSAALGSVGQTASVSEVAPLRVQTDGSFSLREHAAKAGLLFGFAVDVTSILSKPAYRAAVQAQCSIVVPENAMKWEYLAPSPTGFDFAASDALMAFCEESSIKLRGTPLCWHSQLPGWFSAAATAENAKELLVRYIRTVAGRYAGRTHSWDVVNEAVEPNDGRPDGLRNTIWLKLLGPDYIEAAFRAAREADPSALLTYNDYDLEGEQSGAAKRAAVLRLLRGLKQRNVPIDAVGLQSHLVAGEAYGLHLQEFLAACREMDLQVFLSELDVNDKSVTGDVVARDRAVASTYRSYLRTALSASNVTAVLTWGVTDANSWLPWAGNVRGDGQPLRPLLLDGNFLPKPAFVAVRDAFDARHSITVR